MLVLEILYVAYIYLVSREFNGPLEQKVLWTLETRTDILHKIISASGAYLRSCLQWHKRYGTHWSNLNKQSPQRI